MRVSPVFNEYIRNEELQLLKIKKIEQLSKLGVNAPLNTVLAEVNNIADERVRLTDYYDILAVLTDMFFTEHGHLKEEVKPLVTRPAHKLAVEKLCGIHGGIACSPFSHTNDEILKGVENLIDLKKIELRYQPDYWEPTK